MVRIADLRSMAPSLSLAAATMAQLLRRHKHGEMMAVAGGSSL